MKRPDLRRQHSTPPQLAAWLAALVYGSAFAQSADPSSSKPASPFKISGGISYGVAVRATDADTSFLYANNAPVVGLTSVNPAGRNQDDGNLNYRKGHVVSNVGTGFVDFAFDPGPVSALVRLQGWYDYELEKGAVPFGNSVNGYAAGQPLNDNNARDRGKFSNVILSEAWLRSRFSVGEVPVTVTGGNQTIGWRGYGMVPGPMSAIDPVDLMAARRPGAFGESINIPIPTLRMTFKPREDLAVDTFLMFTSRESQTPVCGTFFSVLDAIGEDGCTLTQVGGPSTMSDAQQLAARRVVYQTDAIHPRGINQFGLQARWSPTKTTEVGISAAHYNSRYGYFDMIKSTIPGNISFANGDPRNASFVLVYPTGINTFTIDFKQLMDSTTVYGSVGYTPNRPLGYPVGELSQAFVGNVAVASLFRAQERATAPGGLFEGWDRRHTSELQLGGIQAVRGVLGADTLTLRGELNGRYVHNLPDPSVLRYARPDVFGVGPVNGACAAGASAISCSNDGYVSAWAWGYQVQVGANYPNVLGLDALRPRFTFAQSMHGYSFDGLIKDGRKILTLGLDAVYGKATFGVGLLRNVGEGSTYDNTRDRNFYSASVAMRF